jgi:cardiolipin synthase
MELAEFLTPLVKSIISSAYFITVLVIIGVITLENRNPLKSLSWIIVLLMLPILGIVLYIFFGQNLRKQKKRTGSTPFKLPRSFLPNKQTS